MLIGARLRDGLAGYNAGVDSAIELSDAERAAWRSAVQRDERVRAVRRRAQGIVHTPPVLARCVAQLADRALRERLGLAGGVGDPELALIDPACGPGAFLAAALAVAAERGDANGEASGRVPAAVIGYDRDRRAIAAARAALGPAVADAGWPCELVVADTLSACQPAQLSARTAAVCVIGNPPWIGRAQAAPAPWMRTLLADFERDAEGAPLNERKLGVLADAYVRFLRWSLEVARLARRGAVIALVTNGSYLDGPVHRGLRAMLLRELDELSVYDLGGNALLARSGERDDNVFGVRPQVAILIATRRGREQRPSAVRNGELRYVRLFGTIADKLERLGEAARDDGALAPLATAAPLYRLVPTARVGDEYAGWPALPDLMPFHREGVQTNRDAVVVDVDRGRLLARMHAFAAGRTGAELAVAWKALPHYDPERARRMVAAALERDPQASTWIRPLHYRAFDQRWFVALAPLCHRPRPDLLAAMEHAALALVTVRKDRGALPWTHVSATRVAVDNCLLSTRSSCRARAFPTHAPDGNENVTPDAARELHARVGRAVSSRELLYYALAVLSAPAYRQRYDAALRLDYPRIPWPRNAGAFDALVGAGQQLALLHTTPVEPAVRTAVSAALQDRARELDMLLVF